MLCVTKLSSIQYKDIKCLSFVLLSPGSTEGYFINHCSCFRSPPPEGEEAVKKLRRGRYFHTWLWSLSFRLPPEMGLEIAKEKCAHWRNEFYQSFLIRWKKTNTITTTTPPPQKKKLKNPKHHHHHQRIPHFFQEVFFSWWIKDQKSYRCVTLLILVHTGRVHSCRAGWCCGMSTAVPICFPAELHSQGSQGILGSLLTQNTQHWTLWWS